MDGGGAGVRGRVFSGALKAAASAIHLPLRYGLEETASGLLASGRARGMRADCLAARAEGFGGKMAAARGAFHRGGPAGCGPVAGEKAVGPRRLRGGTCGVDAGRDAEGGADFFDQRGFLSFASLHGRKEFRKLAESLSRWPARGASAAKAREALTTSSM